MSEITATDEVSQQNSSPQSWACEISCHGAAVHEETRRLRAQSKPRSIRDSTWLMPSAALAAHLQRRSSTIVVSELQIYNFCLSREICA